MRIVTGFIMAALVVGLTACGGDETNSDNLGETAEGKKKAFAGIIAGLENPVGAFRVDVQQLIDKSGLEDNAGSAQMLQQGMMMLSALDLETPVRVVADMKDVANVWAIGMIGLNDKTMFNTMVKGQADMGEKIDGFQSAYLETGSEMNALLGFNSHICLVVLGQSTLDRSALEDKMAEVIKSAKSGEKPSGFYNDYINGTEDLAMTYSMGEFLQMIPQSELMDSPIDLETYEGSEVLVSMNFEDGEFVLSGNMSYPETSELSKFYGDGLDQSFANYLAAESFLGYIGVDMNVASIMDIVKKFAEYDDKHEMSPADWEMIDMIDELISGEMTVALVDVASISTSILKSENDDFDMDIEDNFDVLNDELTEVLYEEEVQESDEDEDDVEPSSDMLLTIGILDNEKLISILDTVKDLTLTDGIYSDAEGTTFMTLVENKLVISGNESVVRAMKDGITITVDAAKSLMVNPMSGYIDVVELLSAIRDNTGLEDFDGSEYLDLMEKVIFEGNSGNSSFRIVMKDKGQNALKQMIDVILNGNPAMLGGMMM